MCLRPGEFNARKGNRVPYSIPRCGQRQALMTSNAPTEDDYPLRVGDRVFDYYAIDDPSEEPDLAIVLTERETDVYETTFECGGTETAIADFDRNLEYADYDVSTRVVGIVFAPWLEANIPGWREYASDPEGLAEYVAETAEEWSIPFSGHLYDYPESRLRLVNRP